MNRFINSIGIGILLILAGLLRRKGKNFTSREKRWFNRRRVSEENIRLYGIETGTGIIILGISILIGNYIYQYINDSIGLIMLVVGFFIGIGISMKALSKLK